MQDRHSTKDQLIDKLNDMRRRVTEFEETIGPEAWGSIENSSLRLLEMLDKSNQAYLLIRHGRFEFLNRTCVEMFGYSHVEWSSLPSLFEKVIHPDDREMVGKYCENRIEPHISHHRYVCRIVCKDGSLKWLDIQSSSILWKDEPAFLAVATDITQYIELQKSLEEKTHSLAKRVKELNCLNRISELIHIQGLSQPQILQNIVDLIPTAWRYPEVTCAKISVGGAEYGTNNHAECVSKQIENIIVGGTPVGFVEVGYLEEQGEKEEGPFFREERSLIKAISTHIGEMISRSRSNEESEVLNRAIEMAIHGMGFADADGKVFRVNQAFLRMWGFRSQHEVIGKHISEFMADPNAANELIELLKKGHFVVERTARRNDGSTFEAQLSISSVMDDLGGLVCMMASFLDVTDRKAAEEEIRDREQRFRAISDSVFDPIILVDDKAEICFWNTAAERIFGYSSSEAMTKNVHELLAPSLYHQAAFSGFKDFTQTGRGNATGKISELIASRKNGEEFPIELSLSSFQMHGRWFASGIVRDISERKRYMESQALLTSAVDQAAEAVIVTDAEGKVKYVNPAYSEITGYMEDEIIDRQISVLMYQGQDQDAYRSMWDALNTGGKWTGRLTNKRKDGGNYHENVSVSSINDDMGRITNLVFVSRDVSEEVKLQDQLIQSQKMEAIGTLAGGIAHEFNNVLFAIMGHVELVMDDVPEGSRARLNLEKVLNAVERCSDMVKQILTFSRPKRTKMIPLNLGPLVKDAINFLRSTIPTTIEINQRIEPDQKSVLGDTTQIHQLLMNLCLNASQAMENGKGTMSVELGEVVLDESFAALNPPLVPGRYMRLVLADTGCGISPEIEKKIFDPYFTTKEVGKGTGMGLAVVQGIVRNHNGAITVSSDLGKGSIFSVFLPVLENKESRHEADSFDKIATRGNEHVLLVDDEPAVVEMLKIQLKRLGYKVTCSVKPEDALELFRQDPHGFDVVITDLTMPKMNGLELAEKLSLIRPGLPIILCTGMNQAVSTPDVKEAGISLVIQKPASRSEMAQAVRKVLEWKL